MNQNIHELTRNLTKAPPASGEAVELAQEQCGFRFPADYIELLLECDGAHGWIGDEENSYLILYPLGEAVAGWQNRLESQSPDWYFIFGSSGGGRAYGFDVRERPMPIVEMDWFFELQDHRGKNLQEFLEFLASRDSDA